MKAPLCLFFVIDEFDTSPVKCISHVLVFQKIVLFPFLEREVDIKLRECHTEAGREQEIAEDKRKQ